jgi:Putative S-adenosyl-L-methionine-dependent methyltransferase
VHIQLNSIGRADPRDLDAILPALAQAAGEIGLDHSRLAAVLDWVQYRRNFRAPVMVRPFGRDPMQTRAASMIPLAEIAIDARRAREIPYEALVSAIVDRLSKAVGLTPDVHECIHLEDWVRPSKSVIWSFNRAYWRHLGAWDATFQRDYSAALPGGTSDGYNAEFWHDQMITFVQTLDRLDDWSELPDQINVLEFGVGNGRQAGVWLEHFTQVCQQQGRDYVGRLRYLMADYSPHALRRATQHLTEYADIVDALELDFGNPIQGLEHLRESVLFAHTSNLYDNLPTDELMRVGEHAYEPLVRASITPLEIAELAAHHGVAQEQLVSTIQRVLGQGPEAFGDVAGGVRFWSDVWDAVHLEEIYVPIAAPASMRVAPSIELHLDELLHDLPEWTRVHASTVAVESFAQTLALLHREGTLVAPDIFVPAVSGYAAFRGPGKVEGSVVNWLNGPVFQSVGERAGFTVTVKPFAYREGSNTVVLQARPRDAYTIG